MSWRGSGVSSLLPVERGEGEREGEGEGEGGRDGESITRVCWVSIGTLSGILPPVLTEASKDDLLTWSLESETASSLQ